MQHWFYLLYYYDVISKFWVYVYKEHYVYQSIQQELTVSEQMRFDFLLFSLKSDVLPLNMATTVVSNCSTSANV